MLVKNIRLLIFLLCIDNFTFADISDINITDTPAGISSASSKKPIPQYNFFFHGEPLSECLREFAQNTGYNINISSEISRETLNMRVKGRFVANDNASFLTSLAHQYGFEWFNFSGTIYISSLKQSTSSIAVSAEDMTEIKEHLLQSGLLNSKFSYSELATQNKIVISGPKEYLNLISKDIEGLKINPSSQQFAVFRLKYANAADTQFTYNNQQVSVPGVATLLRRLVTSDTSSHDKVTTNVSELMKNGALESGANANKPDNNNNGNNNNQSSTLSSGTSKIEADDRLNTIIIRDKASNLQLYTNIIKELDVPSPLIQIEVMIIRLDQVKLAQQGINWWASASNIAVGFGGVNAHTNNYVSSYQQINPGQLVVSNPGNFAINLQFLETNKFAQTEAKPSLATTDNLPAIISLTDNIYSNNVQSASSTAASGGIQLIQSLQITPHVIAGPNNKNQIKLSIILQDGSINELSSNLTMPNYFQGYLNSQAVINEGQSIILAGYTKDATVDISNKVPVLGDIPFLGWFFKNSSKELHKITTLYLVTPKIIWLDGIPTANTLQVESHDFKLNSTNYNYKNVESTTTAKPATESTTNSKAKPAAESSTASSITATDSSKTL